MKNIEQVHYVKTIIQCGQQNGIILNGASGEICRVQNLDIIKIYIFLYKAIPGIQHHRIFLNKLIFSQHPPSQESLRGSDFRSDINLDKFFGSYISRLSNKFNIDYFKIRSGNRCFLMLLKVFDRDMYWHYVSANRDPKVVKELLLNPLLLPGFNDSGAHVTNMAFYDGNLRGLRIALEDSEETFSYMVKRLTSEPADFFGLDVGRLDIGSRADMVLINPEALKTYDGDAGIEYIYRDEYDCHQLVNRSDGVVEGVFTAGKKVWHGSAFTETFGRERSGQALTVAS